MTTPEHDAHWYDRMYNNRAMVPDFGQYFDRWVRESAAARSQACSTSVAYDTHSTETLDIFPANRPGAPVLVFIHGGYWRFLDKFDHSFVALPFQRAGCTVVVPNYALCPAVTVPDITLQMVRALAWRPWGVSMSCTLRPSLSESALLNSPCSTRDCAARLACALFR